jgi:hypothetical protein
MTARAERVSIETIREWLAYNAETGDIVWRRSKKGVRVGERAGYISHPSRKSGTGGHRAIKIEQRRFFGHRIAWAMHYGDWPPDGFDVDHINGNRDDNSIVNLRLATRSQNIANSKRSKLNTSGVKGVTWSKRERKWMAQIRVAGKRINLGYYSCIEDAGRAYRTAAMTHFGDFANFGD